MAKGKGDVNKNTEVLQGTLDLMILKTLQAMGPLHGFGIARRLEQLSEEVLRLNEGTVYTSLMRLQQEKWIAAEWGASENNRKAKFYSITKRGLKQLARETEDWERISGVIDRLLGLEGSRPCSGDGLVSCGRECEARFAVSLVTWSSKRSWKNTSNCWRSGIASKA